MRLLVVEDEAGIRDLLVQALGEDGNEVVPAASAEEAMLAVNHGGFDGYILDVLLPGLSGNDLCRWLRDQGVHEPVLMLTALSALADKVEGLDSGADDYLTKPFEIAELRARWRAFQRKALGYPRPEIVVADLVVNPNNRSVTRAGCEIDLSRKEFALLEYLVRNRDRLVTRSMIAQAVWESQTNLYTNVIDVFVAYLRKKIDGDRAPKLIHTVRGKGFLLSETGPVRAS
jgi:two-component system copper resistance phosphate regulon response regulator CusR